MHPETIITSRHTVPVRDESDVYAAVGLARKMTTDMGFAPGAQACAQTITAELARNALRHGGGGTVVLSALESPSLGGAQQGGAHAQQGGAESPSSGESLSLGGQETRRGLEIVVQDRGPGIPDLSRALEGGGAPGNGGARYLGSGLGVGLSSAQRLADEFSIDSVVGSGTRIRALKWDSPGSAQMSPVTRTPLREAGPACAGTGKSQISTAGSADKRSVGAAARPRPKRAGPRALSRRNK